MIRWGPTVTNDHPPEQDLAPATTTVYLLVHRHGPITPTRLSTLSGYSRRHVHRCLNALLEADLIAPDSDPADRRQTRYEPASQAGT